MVSKRERACARASACQETLHVLVVVFVVVIGSEVVEGREVRERLAHVREHVARIASVLIIVSSCRLRIVVAQMKDRLLVLHVLRVSTWLSWIRGR